MNEPRRRFGLIGHPVEHSWSARYFQEKWAQQGIRHCDYGLHNLSSIEDVQALWPLASAAVTSNSHPLGDALGQEQDPADKANFAGTM